MKKRSLSFLTPKNQLANGTIKNTFKVKEYYAHSD